jgi:RNA polymerase sigma factor (sigma-70 family)
MPKPRSTALKGGGGVANPACALDLSKLGDEELIVLAQECQFLPARQELLTRYYDWMKRQIVGHARRVGLGRDDMEDAQAEGVASLFEAIAKYDTLQLGRKTACSFRGFVRMVLQARFRDFLKKLWRVRRRQRPSSGGAALEEAVHGPLTQTDSSPPWREAGDPVQVVEWREQLERLQAALGQLDERSQLLWKRLAAGASLQELAAELEVSYDRVRRWRQQMLADLGTRLQSSRLLP